MDRISRANLPFVREEVSYDEARWVESMFASDSQLQ